VAARDLSDVAVVERCRPRPGPAASAEDDDSAGGGAAAAEGVAAANEPGRLDGVYTCAHKGLG